MTTILNRLESHDLIDRVGSVEDKRIVNVRLTAAGRDVLRTAPWLLCDKFIHRLESLDDWEKTQLLSSLQRIANMMDAEPVLDTGIAIR